MIQRMFNALVMDFDYQKRSGILWAAMIISAMWITILWFLPRAYLSQGFSIVLFSDLTVLGFYFVAGIILLEKGEGVIQALTVTPLRVHEFLAARYASMAILSTILSFLIIGSVALLRNASWEPVLLLPASFLSAILFSMVGFLFVAPFDRITDFLISSTPGLFILGIPVINVFGLLEGHWLRWLFYLIPSDAALIVIRSVFVKTPPLELAYGYTYLILWIVLLGFLSGRVFRIVFVSSRGGKQ